MAADIDKLQGVWYVTSLSVGGEGEVPVMGEQTIEVKADRFESLGMGAIYKGTVKLGKESGVGTIDLVFSAGPEKGNVNRGIYKLSGSKWTLMLNTKPGPRPKKFGTKLSTGLILEELERAPTAAKSRSKATAGAAEPESTAPATVIEGDWQMESAVFGGTPMDPAIVAFVRRTTRGDVTKVVAAGQTMLHAQFTLDAAAGSNAIDYVNLAGANKGKAQEGIYERKGKSLKICMAPPGKPRPAEFASAKGDGRSFTAWVKATALLLMAGVVFGLPVEAQGRGGAPATPPPPPPTWPSSLPTQRVTYRTLTETNYELERLAAANPTKVIRFELPHRSLLGQRIWALEISRNVKVSSGKPVFLMTGVHHAREWPTNELTMEFVNDILKNDGVDPRITAALDNVRFIVVPIVNVDGFDMSRSLIDENKRKSCRVELGKVPTWAECANPANAGAGVDLNRNYGAFWGGGGATIGVAGGSSRGEAPFSEPEIQNIRDIMWSNQITVALSNHTPDARVLRVPSAAEEPTPADVVPYDSLAQLLGGDLKWPAGPWPKIYYVASGTMEETGYYSAGTFSFTFEHAPGQRSFHPPYNFVIDQYSGTGAYPGSSARAGFMRLIEAAADPALHSVLKIKAPAGTKLTIKKSFTMETSGLVQQDTTKGRLPALTFPVVITSSVTVPAGANSITWHVNPSVRASQKAQEWIRESWKLTCVLGAKTKTLDVMVKRGQSLNIDLKGCSI